MKIGVRLRYILLLSVTKLIGWLPTWFLYHCLIDVLYFFLYKVTHYRVAITRENLKNSFPEKSAEELYHIERRFYRHLAEVFVDTIDMTSISRRELDGRIRFIDIDKHESEVRGKNWIAALAHYGSWEYFSAYQFHTPVQIVGVYRPLHDPAFDMFFQHARSRFGLKPVPMNGLLRYIVNNKNSDSGMALGLIADQTPPSFEIDHWFDFLGQSTPFFMGIEKMAARFGMPVYFMRLRKSSRAHYTASFEMIYNGTDKLPEYEITQRYATALESMIRECPELWMWSHRRWKHKPRKGREFNVKL